MTGDPNGVQAAYSFDGAERLTNINQVKGSTTIFSANYSLDNLGNRTAIAENVSGTNRNLSYNYDELSRLTREGQQVGSSSAVTSTYVYDGALDLPDLPGYRLNYRNRTGVIVYWIEVEQRQNLDPSGALAIAGAVCLGIASWWFFERVPGVPDGSPTGPFVPVWG